MYTYKTVKWAVFVLKHKSNTKIPKNSILFHWHTNYQLYKQELTEVISKILLRHSRYLSNIWKTATKHEKKKMVFFWLIILCNVEKSWLRDQNFCQTTFFFLVFSRFFCAAFCRHIALVYLQIKTLGALLKLFGKNTLKNWTLQFTNPVLLYFPG